MVIANPTIQITATTESTSEVQKYNNYKGGAEATGLGLNILNTQQVESGNGNGAHSIAQHSTVQHSTAQYSVA